MYLELKGHDYSYAVEQILLSFFPGQRPVYGRPAGADALSACIALSHGEQYSTAVARLYVDGKEYRGVSRCKTPPKESLDWARKLQQILKLSFYRACIQASTYRPPWGALTGIRPGKIASRLLEAGQSPSQVVEKFSKQYYVHPKRANLCLDTARASKRVKDTLDSRDICLYVGIPFCPSRCTYCSFVSNSVEKSMHLIDPFLQALEQELALAAAQVKHLGLRLRAVYFGGGTPTILSAGQIDALMTSIVRQFDLSSVEEYTVEAGRPDTIDLEKLQIIRRHGATRLSINPQAMDNAILETIGRRHTKEDILQALEQANAVGFPVINMDLIAGLPGQSPEGFRQSLTEVLSLGVNNITVHTLARKKGTKITEKEISAPDGTAMEAMLDSSFSALRQGGYLPYYLYRHKFTAGGFENIGWAKPGADSFYNIAIMEEFCSIFAVGGGASTKLYSEKTGRLFRIFNPKYPYEYIQGMDTILKKKKAVEEFYQEVF